MRWLIALALVAGFQEPTRSESSATVSPMSGDLRVWRGARKKLEAVAKAIQLEAGDRVGSPKGEPASLMAEEDIVLSLKGVKVSETSGLVLARTEAGLVVKLQDGQLLVDAFDKPLTVETAAGKISGKQACFLVEVKDGVSKVTALDGALTFSTGVGEVKVEAGHESSAKAGGEPSAPKPATVVETGPAAGNLVKNPGFEEEPAVGWKAIDAADRQRALDEKIFVSGKRSMRVTVTPATTERLVPPQTSSLRIEQRPVAQLRGRRYLVRVYARLQVRKGKMRVALGVGGVRPNNPGSDMHWISAEVGDAWKMLRVIVQATNEKGEVALRLVLDDETFDATLWADDWSMVELPPIPEAPKK